MEDACVFGGYCKTCGKRYQLSYLPNNCLECNSKEIAEVDINKCFICQHPKSYCFVLSDDSRQYHCPYCGYYKITEDAMSMSLPHFFGEYAPLVAFERNLRGGKIEPLTEQNILLWGNGIVDDYPHNYDARIARSLLNIFHFVHGTIGRGQQTDSLTQAYRLFFSYDKSDATVIMDILKQRKLIKYAQFSDCMSFTLTYEGWRETEKIKKQTLSNDIFIAMWFDSKTKRLQDEICATVERAGYTPKISKEVHHDKYVMDQILNDIMASRLVIADFTSMPEKGVCCGVQQGGVRGGVYYEAGFARGAGKPLIVTCKDDTPSKVRIHFDIKQLNTIFWHCGKKKILADEREFGDVLYARIVNLLAPHNN